MTEPKDPSKSGVIERHIQTILISIVTAALLFAANYIYSDNKDKAIVKSQLEMLTVQVLEMRSDVKLIQSSVVRRDELSDVQHRILDLERRAK